MSKTEDKWRLIRALADKHRKQLVDALLKKPQYISQLADTVKLDRSTVSYNLAVLESAKLLESHYEILQTARSKGKAARVYSVNRAKLKEALDLIKSLQDLPQTA